MQEVTSAIKDLYKLLEKKFQEYTILSQECSRFRKQLDGEKVNLDLREQGIVALEIKHGIVENALRLQSEAEKIKKDAEMLLEVSCNERKIVTEWCDKEKRKAEQAIKDMESFIKAIHDREEKLKRDRKFLEEEKLNFKNTIIKSFDKRA